MCPICGNDGEGYPITHDGKIYTNLIDGKENCACHECWIMRVKDIEAENIDFRAKINNTKDIEIAERKLRRDIKNMREVKQ